MKNFPHQINQIPRLVTGLEVFGELIGRGENVLDDGVVGDALAISGVYTFREKDLPIQRLLENEHNKPKGSQGTRTCARELRRLYHLLGFLTERDRLTEAANSLIRLKDDPLSVEARSIWSIALDQMQLVDTSGASHPYRIMLRIVGENPGISGVLLGLCLEAANDTETEYDRISNLARTTDPQDISAAIGVSDHMARNSVKILPALARQLGDILESQDGYHLGQAVISTTEEPTTRTTTTRALRSRRPYNPNRLRVQSAAEIEEGQRTSTRAYDPDLVGARYEAHEGLLQRFSSQIPEQAEQFEGDYDLLILDSDQALLIEAKTIKNDEAKQVRQALGQLLYYEHMFVEPMCPNHQIKRILLTDKQLYEDLITLLEKHGIGVVWLSENGEVGQSTLGQSHLSAIKVSLP